MNEWNRDCEDHRKGIHSVEKQETSDLEVPHEKMLIEYTTANTAPLLVKVIQAICATGWSFATRHQTVMTHYTDLNEHKRPKMLPLCLPNKDRGNIGIGWMNACLDPIELLQRYSKTTTSWPVMAGDSFPRIEQDSSPDDVKGIAQQRVWCCSMPRNSRKGKWSRRKRHQEWKIPDTWKKWMKKKFTNVTKLSRWKVERESTRRNRPSTKSTSGGIAPNNRTSRT